MSIDITATTTATATAAALRRLLTAIHAAQRHQIQIFRTHLIAFPSLSPVAVAEHCPVIQAADDVAASRSTDGPLGTLDQ